MPQSPETKFVIDLLRRIIAHARTVIGDNARADRAVREALASNPRRPGPDGDRSFVIGVLGSISSAAREAGPGAPVLPQEAVSGAIAGLEPQDREALSLQGVFGLSPQAIAQVMGEPAEVTRERIRRSVAAVATALVPRAVASCP